MHSTIDSQDRHVYIQHCKRLTCEPRTAQARLDEIVQDTSIVCNLCAIEAARTVNHNYVTRLFVC